jgi:hypothetical protein
MPEQWLLSLDAARLLGCGPDLIGHLAKTGQLPCEYAGARRVKLFRLADVQAFAKQRAEFARRKKLPGFVKVRA